MRAGRAAGPAAAIASKSRWEPGGKTRSSQLAPSATLTTRLANAPDAKAAPRIRFMSLAPYASRLAARCGGSLFAVLSRPFALAARANCAQSADAVKI